MDLWKKYKKTDICRVKVPKSVSDLTEIKRISEDGIWEVGTGGIYTKTYRLDDINYSLLSREEKISILEKWCKFFNSKNTPVKLTVIKNDRDEYKFKSDVCFPEYGEDEYDNLRHMINDNIISSQSESNTEQRIYITMRLDDVADYDAAKTQFGIIEDSLYQQAKGFGSVLHILSSGERLKVLHDFYRTPEEKFKFDIFNAATSGCDYLSGIVPGKIDLTDEKCMEFSFNGRKKYVSCLYLQNFGTALPEGFLTSLLALDIRIAISVDVYPISSEDVSALMNKKYANLRSLIKSQNKHQVNNLDFSSEITKTVSDDYNNIKNQMNDFKNKSQHYFYTMVNFAVTADTKDKLQKDCELLMLTVKNLGTDSFADYSYLRQRESLNTILPIGVKNVSNGRNIQTKVLAPFSPFTMKELYDTEGIWYGKNQKNGDTIMLDRRKLLNPHGWIFGETGAGKTGVAAISTMEIFLKYSNSDIIIIDPKNHFKEFAEKTSGVYYDISPNSNIRINPFAYYDTGQRGDMSGDKNGILLAMTEVCKKAPVDARERTVLGRALTAAYALNRKEVSFTDIYNCLLKVGNPEIANDLRLYLEYFMTGPLSIFAGCGNTDINNRVTVYGLMNMGKALRELSMLVIFESIKERVYYNYSIGRATWIIIDEAPEMLVTPAEQSYINSAWMLYRSLGGILTGIAQSVTQLTRTTITKELIENSEFYMVMKQQDAASGSLATYLGLSESELNYVFAQSEPGKGLIKYGKTTVPFDMSIEKESPLYDMINTSFHELHKE